ncbi:serine hydrolase domain-containing protein [Undibacterium sp. TJN25]|uniref:serine hydrolase domain-containing protein n=1 Tax=Undibacterium sp. TJN25 TaxID=3413056 RepID=UPI003BF088FC
MSKVFHAVPAAGAQLVAAVIAVIAAIALATPAHAQETKPMPPLDQQLQSIVSNPLRPLASLSVLAIRDGKVTYLHSFGERRIDVSGGSKGEAAGSQTLYRVASVSKLVAAIAALHLVEQGKLDLDADISRYLGFNVRNPYFPDTAITTRMLLSHTSSLRDEGGYSFPVDVTLGSVLLPAGKNYGKGLQWAAPIAGSNRAPGKYFEYCNFNWGVIGSVIEAVSGQRFDRYMQQAVLAPLHIRGGYNAEELTQDDINNLAVLYRKQGSDEVWNTAGPWVVQTDDYQGKLPAPRKGLDSYIPGSNATLFSPQGGLRISAAGLSRIMLMLMSGGELDGARILSATSVNAMLSEQWHYDAAAKNGDNYQGLFQAWGLGAQHFSDTSAAHAGDRVVAGGGFKGYGHLGFAWGLNSGFIFDPVARNGMIYIIGGVGADPDKNRGEYSSLNIWEEQILDVLYRGAIVGP